MSKTIHVPGTPGTPPPQTVTTEHPVFTEIAEALNALAERDNVLAQQIGYLFGGLQEIAQVLQANGMIELATEEYSEPEAAANQTVEVGSAGGFEGVEFEDAEAGAVEIDAETLDTIEELGSL